MDDQQKMALATRRVDSLAAFYYHLTAFVVVMVILFAVNLFLSKSWWVEWPLLGWGVAVLTHAFMVFAQPRNPMHDWKSRKVEELKNKM